MIEFPGSKGMSRDQITMTRMKANEILSLWKCGYNTTHKLLSTWRFMTGDIA